MSDPPAVGDPDTTPVEFFQNNLKKVVRYALPGSVRRQISPFETRYVAEALTHFATESAYEASTDKKKLPTLEEIYEQVMINKRVPNDSSKLEIYGAAIWVENGFFSHMQRARSCHSTQLYVGIGRLVLQKAAEMHKFSTKKQAMSAAAQRFETWQFVCAALHDWLKECQFALPELELLAQQRQRQLIIH